ncbi:MAG: flavodoxin-dependent (E)-4-hydroxy-3-methylbut-2-enyl-diphosphate synthase, partial [Anaerovoracaceae bacterium]
SDYPLHIGVTEAGTVYRGEIKSAVGIGALLLSGIGNTMRVSLTGDPVAEVITAKKILSAVGLGAEPIDLISCPTCGRTTVNLEKLCLELERELAPIGSAREKAGKPPLKIAVMGCEVNGPGEAAGADLGVACGKGKGAIFSKGKILKTVEEEKIKEELMRMVKEK